MEQSWTFEKRPDCDDDLVVRVDVEGQEFLRETPSGLHFVNEQTGLGLRYGHGTWIDDAGVRRHISAAWIDGAIELRVPPEILRESSFPAILDPLITPEFGMDMSVSSRDQFDSDVAFDGSNYLVVWADGRNYDSESYDIYGVRVAPDGTLLDVPAILVGQTQGSTLKDLRPSIASGDGIQLVTWIAGSQIKAVRMDSTGQVLDSPPLSIPVRLAGRPVYVQESVQIADGNDRFLVVWSTHSGVFASRISSAGVVEDTTPIMLYQVAGDKNLSVAFGGESFSVVWSDGDHNTSGRLYGVRVSPSGSVIDSNPIHIAQGLNFNRDPRLSFDGSNYLLVWKHARQDSEIVGTLVRRDGSVLNHQGTRLAGPVGYNRILELVFDGSSYLLLWGQSDRVYGTQIGAVGPAQDLGSTIGPATQFQDGLTPRVPNRGPSRYRYGAQAAIASERPGEFLVTYDEAVRLYGNPEVEGRFISYPSPLAALYQTLALDEDTQVDIELEGFDPGNGPLQFSIATPPAHGSLSGAPPAVRYTPNSDYFGMDHFVFEVTNTAGESDRANVWITVRPIPDAPMAVDDDASTAEDQVVMIDVMANDREVDGQQMSISQFTQPAHGIVTETTVGAFLYKPDLDFVGDDRFDYSIVDPDGQSDSADVAVTVNPKNDAPRLVPPTPEDGDVFAAREGDVLVLPLAAVDPDDTELNFSVEPDLSRAQVDQDDDSLRWSVDWRDAESNELRIVVTDPQGATDGHDISVVVEAVDTDEDGVSDSREDHHGLDPTSTDSDGDGIHDADEWGDGEAPVDTDGDGEIDALDRDSDGDGIDDDQDACRLAYAQSYDGCGLESEIQWGNDQGPSNHGCGCRSGSGSAPPGSALLLCAITLLGLLRRRDDRIHRD